MKPTHLENLAMAAVMLSGAAWGLYWIPLRALDDAGIAGIWSIVLFYVLPALLLMPLVCVRRRHIMKAGWPLHLAGVLAGTALVLYAGALVFTDVVRALLLYYLTPLWSTLLARALIGEAITGLRWAAMGLTLLGMLLILNIDSGLTGALNVGDWMGLASGIVWALAAVRMKADGDGKGIDLALSYFFWGSIAALALTLLPLPGAASPPDWQAVRGVLVWLVPVVLILAIPSAFAVMWGATVLSPGLLSILFMTEISAGTITAAIWADEPFGWRELSGVVLISAAGMLEPVVKRRRFTRPAS